MTIIRRWLWDCVATFVVPNGCVWNVYKRQKKSTGFSIHALTYCNTCALSLNNIQLDKGDYIKLWSSAARQNISSLLENKTIKYVLRRYGEQYSESYPSIVTDMSSWEQHQYALQTSNEMFDEISIASSPNNCDNVTTSLPTQKDVYNNNTSDNQPIIDLCFDSDSSVDSTVHVKDIIPYRTINEPNIDHNIRRPRLIDLCLQRAFNTNIPVDTDSMVIEDDEDRFLIDVKLNKLDEDLVHKNVPAFYFPFLNDSNISQEEKYNKLMATDYMTDNLSEEIESLYPRAVVTNDRVAALTKERVHSESVTNCIKFFRVHRTFVNYKQLMQAVKIFGSA